MLLQMLIILHLLGQKCRAQKRKRLILSAKFVQLSTMLLQLVIKRKHLSGRNTRYGSSIYYSTRYDTTQDPEGSVEPITTKKIVCFFNLYCITAGLNHLVHQSSFIINILSPDYITLLITPWHL